MVSASAVSHIRITLKVDHIPRSWSLEPPDVKELVTGVLAIVYLSGGVKWDQILNPDNHTFVRISANQLYQHPDVGIAG